MLLTVSLLVIPMLRSFASASAAEVAVDIAVATFGFVSNRLDMTSPVPPAAYAVPAIGPPAMAPKAAAPVMLPATSRVLSTLCSCDSINA